MYPQYILTHTSTDLFGYRITIYMLESTNSNIRSKWTPNCLQITVDSRTYATQGKRIKLEWLGKGLAIRI